MEIQSPMRRVRLAWKPRLLALLEEPAMQEKRLAELLSFLPLCSSTFERACKRDPAFAADVEAKRRRPWRIDRQRVLDLLTSEEHRYKPISMIAALAGITPDSVLKYTRLPEWQSLGCMEGRFASRMAYDIWLVLRDPAHATTPLREVCRLAGYTSSQWGYCLLDPVFAAEVAHISPSEWAPNEQAYLNVIREPVHRDAPVSELVRLAGYDTGLSWRTACDNPRFIQAVADLGRTIKRRKMAIPHRDVALVHCQAG